MKIPLDISRQLYILCMYSTNGGLPWNSLSETTVASLSTIRSAGRSRPRSSPALCRLPSIRGLAKDLKISVITTKRAYDELEAQGLINTVAGKGCFVAEPDLALFREQSLHLLEDHLAAAAELARTCGLSESELAELLRRKWEGSL